GGADDPYMLRWWLTPWSAYARGVDDADKTWWQWLVTRLPGIYLHFIVRSDDDRALHDHPWMNCSIVLRGGYIEHTIDAGGIHRLRERKPGDIVFRRARSAHRLEVKQDIDEHTGHVVNIPCWSLFICGFRVRHWGFHCPTGWVHWRQFTSPDDRGAIGRGCQ